MISKFLKKYYKIFITIILILFIIFFWKIFLILLFSFIFAYLLNPIVKIFNNKMKLPLTLSVIITLAIIIGLLVLLILNFVPFLISQFNSLNESIPSYFNKFYNTINYIKIEIAKYKIENMEVIKLILTKLETFFKVISNSILNITFSIILSIPYIILILIFSFYFLKDKDLILNYILKLFENKEEKFRVFERINHTILRYIGATLFDALLVGIVTTIGLFIIGVDYSIVLGSITGVLVLIPYIGPILSAIPPIIISYLKFHSINKVLLIILLYFSIGMINGYAIQPRIIGESTNLHPAIILILLLIGGELFGAVGLILIIPFTIILKEGVRAWWYGSS